MSAAHSQNDPAREWHVMLSGERRGPYTLRALYDVLDTHPAGWTALVWRPGMLDWRPAQEVRALLQDAQTSVHASQGVSAAIFLDEPSELALASRPLAARARARSSAQTTQDMPVYGAPQARSSWRRSLLAAVLGSAVAIGGILLLRTKLTSVTKRVTPASSAPASPHSVAARPVEARGSAHEQQVEALAESLALAGAHEHGEVAASSPSLTLRAEAPRAASPEEQSPRRASKVRSVRVRARWAPVRADGDPAAEVLCSLPRGAEVAVFAERPGTHARWFEVRCDARTPGWLHENFLARVRDSTSVH